MTSDAHRSALEILFAEALFRALPGLAYVFDETGRFVRWNSGYQRLLGLSDAEMAETNAIDVAVPRDRERIVGAMREVLEGKEVSLQCHVGRAGREIPIVGTGVLVRVEDKSYVVGTAIDVSAQIAAEVALERSERNYRQIFNANNDAMFIHDAQGRIVDVNDQMCALFRCTREMVIDPVLRPNLFAGRGYTLDAALDRMRRAVEEGPQVFEWLCRRLDGDKFWAEISLRATEIAGERRLIASLRDISERKRTEAALKESERRLALAISANADAIWEMDLESNTTYVSPRWFEMLGYRDQDFPVNADTLLELCHPDDFGAAREQMRATLSDPNAPGCAVEFRMRRADGSWAWILARGAVTKRSPDGKPLAVCGTNTDISRSREAEREAIAWKQRYDLLTRAAGQLVYDCGADGSIVWGGAVQPLLGYVPGEMQGGYAQWVERVHSDDQARAARSHEQASAQGIEYHCEYRFRRKDGAYIVVQDTGYPQFDEQGHVLRYIGVMADVTEQRRAETERQRLEESLRQAQKMESIGRLAGGVAHDFNNLLTAISGNLSLALLDDQPEALRRELLLEATKASESAALLTRQLLTFSRKQVIQPRPVCLNDTVHGLQKMLRRLLGEDIALSVSLANDLGQVHTDEAQIEQVLVNLAVNARDAMPKGGKLQIETKNTELDADFCRQHGQLAPGAYVMVAVSDDGVGMGPEVQKHLFEPFFTTKETGKGTGLGLAMVYGAIQQNRGHISVESAPALGTTVRIYLPRTTEQRRQDSMMRPETLASGKETIVVVEDEEHVRLLAQRILVRQGYRVEAYATGEDALAALQRTERSVDLLITDIIMPGMNGRELAERATVLLPGLKVLYTSGYSEVILAPHGVLDDAIAFIAKPYTLQTLTLRVREVLDRTAQTSGST